MSSAFTRCITKPLEVLSTSMGRCLRLVLSEVPAQWQPLLMMTIVALVLLSVIMVCRYSVILPFMLRIEPKAPVQNVKMLKGGDDCDAGAYRKKVCGKRWGQARYETMRSKNGRENLCSWRNVK